MNPNRILCSAFLLIFLTASAYTYGQKTVNRVYDSFSEFENQWLSWSKDTILVINFWATWCKPCVHELPYFEQLVQSKHGIPLKVILVSIDRKSDIDSRLNPFLAKREMTTDVFALTDGRAHEWIDKVSPEWSGAVPATVLLKKGKKAFYEKEFESYEELLDLIKIF